MKNREKKKRKLYFGWAAVAVLAIVFVAPALAEDEPNEPVLPDPNMPEELQLPGTVEGTGTYFEVTDSNYLNITFESSEPVNLRLESVPQMIVMDINTVAGTSSTQITLTGFPPSTTYYKYEDNYHNGAAFTTDDNGTYTFVQDLIQPHLVFIQPNSSTIFIPSDTSVGTWNPVNRIYTLTTDVYESIQIDEDNLTLNGAGHTVIGTGSGYGIYLYERTGVTVENVNVWQFACGIQLYRSDNNILTDNTTSSNYIGIWPFGITLTYSSNNILIGNTVSMGEGGIFLGYSNNNTLINNNASNNPGDVGGITVGGSGNTLTGNTASNNFFGIILGGSGNTLTGNTTSNNWGHGIILNGLNSGNSVTGNTSSNNHCGISISFFSSDNQIYNNNFIDNATQAYVHPSCTGNVFNLDKPIGGNYWSDWTSPDADGDGFVDDPYVFNGGQDNLPWIRPDGWLVTLVEIDIKPGSYPNAINLGSYGLVPVAILSSEEFDATTVDPDSVELAGAGVEVRGKSNKYMAHTEDVNGDDLIDLVLQVATQNLDPDSFQDGYAILTGQTYDGVSIEGQDEITIVPPEQ